jgi:hypothetical protein
MYREIFPEPEFEPLKHDGKEFEGKIDYRKIYKIKYSVNLFPQIGPHYQRTEAGSAVFMNDDVDLTKLLINHEELEKYDAETMQSIIKYKWDKFGRKHHFLGCCMHFINTLLLILYVALSYI